HLFPEEVSRMRQDRRHAGSHLLPLPKGAVAHPNPLHVGDRILLSRRENPRPKSVIPQALTCHGCLLTLGFSVFRPFSGGSGLRFSRREKKKDRLKPPSIPSGCFLACLPQPASPDFWTSPRVCYDDTEKKPHAQGDTIGGTRDDSGNIGGRSPQQPPSPLGRCPCPGRVRGGDRAV